MACALAIACVVLDPACSPRPEPYVPRPASTGPVRADAAAPIDASSAAKPPCKLEVPADGTPCQPGELDYRGNLRGCCPATCDKTGRWRPAGPCVMALCESGRAYFARGGSEPDADSVAVSAARLKESSGRYYVLGQIAPDERDVQGLDRARAHAVKARLVALGCCEEKFVPLAGGVIGGLTEGSRLPDRMRPLGQLILISEHTDQELRDAGILD